MTQKPGQKGISPFLAVPRRSRASVAALSGLLTGSLVFAHIILFATVGARQVADSKNTQVDTCSHEPNSAFCTGARVYARQVANGEKTTALTMHAAPSKAQSTLLSVVNHADITETHRLLADSTLRALPPACRTTLKSFYVDYKKPKRRGWGGATTMIIDGRVSAKEFRALIAHECGHIVDLGYFKGTIDSGMSEFFDGNEPIFANDVSLSFYRIDWLNAKTRMPDADASHFVSGYAASDPFEDFAEAFAFFALQRDEFAHLAQTNAILKAKYDWMARNVFAATPQIALGRYVSKANRPWDVTKLEYLWLQ